MANWLLVLVLVIITCGAAAAVLALVLWVVSSNHPSESFYVEFYLRDGWTRIHLGPPPPFVRYSWFLATAVFLSTSIVFVTSIPKGNRKVQNLIRLEDISNELSRVDEDTRLVSLVPRSRNGVGDTCDAFVLNLKKLNDSWDINLSTYLPINSFDARIESSGLFRFFEKSRSEPSGLNMLNMQPYALPGVCEWIIVELMQCPRDEMYVEVQFVKTEVGNDVASSSVNL